MKIGILECGHLAEELENKFGPYDAMFATLLAGNGFEFDNFAVVDNQFPQSVEVCDGWLVTGSKHGAYEAHDWIPPLEKFIRNSYASDIPIAGICFGHQIMAQALGGKVIKFPKGWKVGHTKYAMNGSEFDESDRQMELLAMHQDQVVELPPEADVIATSDFCANAGLAYKGNALSFQPHPEFTPEFMRELIEFKMTEGFSKSIGDAAINSIEESNDAAKIATQLAEFFQNAQVAKVISHAAE